VRYLPEQERVMLALAAGELSREELLSWVETHHRFHR
jgi:hypothetical protein